MFKPQKSCVKSGGEIKSNVSSPCMILFVCATKYTWDLIKTIRYFLEYYNMMFTGA